MKFMRNVGGIDRAARLCFGIALIVLSYIGLYPVMALTVISYVIGIVLLATGLFGYCPINQAIGFNSCRVSGFSPEEPEKPEEKKVA